MQTAVQTITEATAGPKASGRHTVAKTKQPGGFAALLSAFFSKGGQPEGLGMAGGAAGEGEQPEATLKGKVDQAKKGQPLAGLKATPKELLSLKEGEGETDASESALLPFMGESPLISASHRVEPVLSAVLAQGMAEEGAEKSAGAGKGRGPSLPAAKGGADRMPLQAGGGSVGGNQPQHAGEMGVDRFAALMRNAVQPKKAPGTEQAGPSLAHSAGNPLAETLTASSDNKAAEALAGTASGVGAKKNTFASGLKADGAKGGLHTESVQSGAGQAARKENPLLAGRESRGKAAQAEEPAVSPRVVKPVSMDRSGVPVQQLAPEAMAALNELEPSLAAETPKAGLTRQLALQVGRQIATSLKKNDQEVTFQVRPPSLGRIQMRIEKEGERISVRIVSEKEKAGEILAAGKQELRALLADHGIRVDRIEVEAGGTMDLMAQDGGTEGRDGRGRSSPRQGGQGRPGDVDHEATPPENKRHDGVISVMV